jgi:hypothetical protein
MENKHKHLEFIQDLIERMSGNSFLLKRWGVTIVTALIAIGTKEKDLNTLLISFIPVGVFWILDGFYLYKERLCRSLYEKVRNLTESEIDFNMNTYEFVGGKNSWVRAIFSTILIIFYLTLILSMLLVIIFLK